MSRVSEHSWSDLCLFSLHSIATTCWLVLRRMEMPSVLWHCWLGGRKGIRPVKNWAVGCWRGCLSGVRCILLHVAQLMPLPLTVSCFSKIQIGFTFLVPAYPGSPGKKSVKRVCVWERGRVERWVNLSSELLYNVVTCLSINWDQDIRTLFIWPMLWREQLGSQTGPVAVIVWLCKTAQSSK